MDIKKRLITFNSITIIIPFIVTIIIAYIFIFISSASLSRDISYDNFKKLLTIKSELLDLNTNISKQTSSDIEDVHLQQYLSKRLLSINGEFILTKEDNVIFASKNINKIDIARCLEEVKNNSLQKNIKINNISYIVEVAPLKFKNEISGNVILLAPDNHESQFIEKFIIAIIVVFFICFILVNTIMSYLFSKRILNPISLLKNATAKISKGDLDYEIVETGDKEIRELCSDFEHMRIELKNSIHMKMKYDDNRRMLVSSISHDLKTPITSIKGYANGLLDGVANTPEKVDHYLKTIYSKAELIDVMIDDLLLYSKLDLNQIPFKFEKTNIVEYFNYCICESAPELERSNIKIHLKNDLNHSKYVMIDRDRLKRVILNIIDNSRKYMDKNNGEIVIMLRETNSSIVIELRDNGYGIDKNDTNKIFNRFYRGDSARTGANGSGLGLAIAKQIVEGHNGRIWAVSHENKGTSILISLAKIPEE
ncbi:HAMP domain-containing sensor histidine kinase [Clostridium sp. JS66]|uniref:sensor histidine kinase n=1 Tax=Clostridium sp. JS66 TaxID=3064705 RepID=UPI00298E1766|nr:HAMP domain-containing sensor histidine kinase [Clostridium sp. JS66]WPC42421.1 HAMP domain-containing sensor histidine kinase [Clostridium sp. JS66]